MVNNRSFAYTHVGYDFNDSTLPIVRCFRSRSLTGMASGGSFGPDQWLNYDVFLQFGGNSFGNGVIIGFIHGAIDDDEGANGNVQPVAFSGVNSTPVSSIRSQHPAVASGAFLDPIRINDILVLNSSQTVITPTSTGYSDPKFLTFRFIDGREMTFECVNTAVYPAPTTGSNQFNHGRLVKHKSAKGKTLVFAYKSFTTAQLTADPTLQTQIDTISDGARSIAVQYASTQLAGRWVISQLTYPGSRTTTYQYNTTNLTTVTHADNSQSTFTYGSETNGLRWVDIVDPVAAPQHRRKKVWMNGGWTSIGGTYMGSNVHGLTRVIANGENEVTYAMFKANGGSTALIYEGGGKLQTPQDVSYRRHFSSWTADASGGALVISGTAEATYEEFWGTRTKDNSGHEIQYEYDVAQPQPVQRKIYDDATFESFCYLPGTAVMTRSRDRSGMVTRYTHDSEYRIIKEEFGLKDDPANSALYYNPYYGWVYNPCPPSDLSTSAYGFKSYEYHGSGANGAGQLKAVIDELGNRTDYEYDTYGRLVKIKQPPSLSGGTRPETQFFYDTNGRLSVTADPAGWTITNTYDSMDRITKKTYSDGTSEETIYGTTGSSVGLVTRTIDRMGVVTTYAYDLSDRLVTQVVAYSKMNGTTETMTPEIAQTITMVYVTGTDQVFKRVVSGSETEYTYDYRGRVVETKTKPSAGVTLSLTKEYVNNQLFYSQDAYGRRVYYAYDASDGRLIRTVQFAVPGQTLANFAAVLAYTRPTGANPVAVVTDVVYDASGNAVQRIDGLGTIAKSTYDSRDRETLLQAAFGTSIEAKTETFYDAASNIVEVRSPRYFDSADTNGYLKDKQTWTYDGGNRVKTHTEAAGSSEAATESFTYDLKGRQTTHTDFAGKVWTTIFDSCCDKSLATKNPLGHGGIRNTNARGLTVHTATVSDTDAHTSDMVSPVDAKTLAETTTKFDGRGRPVAATTWLVALGAVDVENPPIAGYNGVAAANGLTTQYLYDDNLADGLGMDSTSGLSYTKMTVSGTASVSLTTAISKLAETQANGGAGLTFSANAPGRATVTISPQDEVAFSISDATGRTVMSGQLDNYSGTANALLTWNCRAYDAVTSIAGYGDCLETRTIDPLGNATKSLSDGVGRTIRTIDQLSKQTNFTYDAGGNQLSLRDPNSVGQDVVYDALGRAGLTTDTTSATTNSSYDKAGNRIAAIDGKTKSTLYTYDARGRQKSQKDRLNGTTTFTYRATGQLASLQDAESQTTAYTYDDAGNKLTEQYPDHTGGSPGSSTYGIVTFTNDSAGRVLRKQDQLGDTCTYTYDLAGRLTQRDYRTLANSPSGTITDSDVFTYDKAGRMLTATSGRYSNTVTYTYDTAGRKKTESLTISTKTYTTTTAYNTRSEVSQYTYPDSAVVERTYTARGELYQLKHAGATIETRTYDDGGRLVSEALNNSVTETRTYNNDNTLATISDNKSIGNLTYAWDANKNKTGETISGTMSNYGFSIPTGGYDDEDRLVNFTRTAGLNQSWNLSLVGDWNSITTNGTAQNRTHGPSHELLTGASQAVTTDVKGNITLIPSGLRTGSVALSSSWDFDNRLSSATSGFTTVSHQYDALGRRVARTEGSTTIVYVPSGQQTVCDYTSGAAASASTYRYVYASYIDEPVLRITTSGGASTYYHRNQQYSVTALTDSSGTIVERYAYSAYGVPTITDASGSPITSSGVNNRYTYTGREWDEKLELYHYRARMYDPALGRFCSRDPIGYWDGTNLYRGYFATHGLDPSGLLWVPQDPPPWVNDPRLDPPNRTDPWGNPIPNYYPEYSLPRNAEQLRAWLNHMLSANCSLCNYCNGAPEGCNEVRCMQDARRIADAIANTINNNGNRNPYTRFPFGIDNTWPWFPIPTFHPNERFRGYFCYRWAQVFDVALDRIGSPCFSGTIEAALEPPPGIRYHFWLTIKSGCDSSEIYVDDSFWDRFFGHTKHPCGEPTYPYTGPTNPDPTLPGGYPTPYTPDNHPIPVDW